MLYTAKVNTWFDSGTEVKLIDDYRPETNAGLFLGLRKGHQDEEVCPFDEFESEEKV